MRTIQSKIFALFQFGGSVPLLGLFVATVTAHVLVMKDVYKDVPDKTKRLAIVFTSSYTAVIVYGLANAASALFVFSSSSGIMGSILYCAFDALFVICVGGALLGSQATATDNGGGVAMMAFLLLLLALKLFPTSMVKFKVLENTLVRTKIPFKALMFIGIGAITIGGVAVLGAALTVLSVYIRVLYHDDDQFSSISLLSLNVPIFLSAVLLVSFTCLLFLKDKLTAHSVDVINFFTQLILGYILNGTIDFLYFGNTEWKYGYDKTFVFYYNSLIALTVFIILMMISTIFISVIRPFVSSNEDFSDDERKPLNH